jgi:TolB-like protein/DNA-binding winged helix-turn-helix (wHTH) protein/Tfp pilus assembly protein PilF
MTIVDNQCEFGGVQIQPELNIVVRDGETKKVSPRVMDVLMYLVTHSDRVIGADELLTEFWPGRVVEESTVHRLISQIRGALGDSASEQRFIKTISKRGYQAIASIDFGRAPPSMSAQVDLPEVTLPEVTQEAGDQYVFICYSHMDSRSVFPEIEWLAEQGVKVWYDRGISAGANWRSAIGDSLLAAAHVLYFVSENSLASSHCNNEVNLAIDEGVPVIPIFLESVELTSDLKVGLNRIQWLNYTDADYRSALLHAVNSSRTVKRTSQAARLPVKSKRPMAILAGVLLLAVVSAGWYFGNQSIQSQGLDSIHAEHAHLETIAVLPFINLSADPSLDFFGQGLTDVMLDRISKSPVLKVASRTSAFQIAAENLGVETIAERLGVAYVVEGSVQKNDNNVRITVQLIRGSDGFHAWSKTYDREFSDPFKIQEEVGLNAAVFAEGKLYIDANRQAPELYDAFKGVNHRAVGFYLDANDVSLDANMGETADMTHALQLLESAVAIDPSFADAQLDRIWHYMRRTDPSIPVAEASARIHAAIDEFLSLGQEDFDQTVQFYLAQVYMDLDLNYAEAERLTHKLMVDTPDTPFPPSFLGQIGAREGRQEDAERHFSSALARVRNFGEHAPLVLNGYARQLIFKRKFADAIRATEEAQEFIADGQPGAESLLLRARALIGLDRQIEARAAVEQAWLLAGTKVPSKFAPLYVLLGETARARKILQDATPENRTRGDFVETYLLLGDLPSAFAMLRAAIEDHDPSVLDIIRTRDPGPYDAIRDDPRFVELLQLLESKETHTAKYLSSLDG